MVVVGGDKGGKVVVSPGSLCPRRLLVVFLLLSSLCFCSLCPLSTTCNVEKQLIKKGNQEPMRCACSVNNQCACCFCHVEGDSDLGRTDDELKHLVAATGGAGVQ